MSYIVGNRHLLHIFQQLERLNVISAVSLNDALALANLET